jgi:hypothetical protein
MLMAADGRSPSATPPLFIVSGLSSGGAAKSECEVAEAGEFDGGAVGEFGDEGEAAAERLDRTAEGGDVEVGAFFDAGDLFLFDSQT